jgi:hypothetical protein
VLSGLIKMLLVATGFIIGVRMMHHVQKSIEVGYMPSGPSFKSGIKTRCHVRESASILTGQRHSEDT